jgi:spore coat polysaccharide biosynthesis predicted glycosyltransferase SpsG
MGHLFRALNLADGFRERGWPLIFLVNSDGAAAHNIEARGYRYEFVPLGTPNGWELEAVRRLGIRLWINDRLNTDIDHARRLKSVGLPLVTFDDRGEGARLADVNVAALVFDQEGSLPGARVLRGPEFLILDPEIARYRRVRKHIGSTVVTMGGSDTYGVTVKVVRQMATMGKSATVVLGPSFADEDALLEVATPAFEIKRNVPSLIAELGRHDLAITGGGITPFEAAASGLPCIVIASEDFEIPVGRALESIGAARFAGYHEAIDWDLFEAEPFLEGMSRTGIECIGLGGRDRVLDAIQDVLIR